MVEGRPQNPSGRQGAPQQGSGIEPRASGSTAGPERRQDPGPDQLAADLVDLVARRAGAAVEAEVSVAEARLALTRFANSAIHQNVAEESRHIRLKVVLDGRQASATTNRTDRAGLDHLVDEAVARARLRPVDPGWPGLAPAAPESKVDHYDPATHMASPGERAEVVRDFVGLTDPQARAAGYCDSTGYTLGFANSAGHHMVGRASRASIEAIHRATWPGAGVIGSGRAWQSSVCLGDLDGASAGRVAAAKARAGADVVALEPGTYEVVLEPAAVADVVDFLVGYGSNAKSYLEGQSWVEIGAAQLDASIDIWDDAADDRTTGLGFDAEGTPKAPLDLVRGGVSMGLAHDRRTAAAAGDGAVSTGHGIEGGEHWGAFCTNLFMGPGSRSAAELVASVERGILITELWYTRVLDPKTQVVTGLTRNGTFLIEGGRIGPSVGDLRFTQSYVEALGPGSVLGVGDDARLTVAGSYVPSVALKSWNITGSAGR